MQYSGALAEIHRRRVPDDEPRLEQHVEAVAATFIKSFDDSLHRSLRLLTGFLADSGQIDMSQSGEHAVVISGERNVAGNVDPGTTQLVEQPDRTAVVGRTHCSRAVALLQQLTSSQDPGLFGEVTVDNVDRIGQPVPLHGAHISSFAIVGNGAASATEVANPTMSELDQVVYDSSDAAPVGGAHYVDRRARGASPDDDD